MAPLPVPDVLDVMVNQEELEEVCHVQFEIKLKVPSAPKAIAVVVGGLT